MYININKSQENNKYFTFTKKKYRAFDILTITFKIAPIQFILLMFLTIVDGIIPSALLALGTGKFVDTATAIFYGFLPYNKIYFPLILLIVILGLTRLLSGIYFLLESNIRLLLERNLIPAIVEVQAKLKYDYIEDPKCQEIMDITADEMEETFIDGIDSYLSIISSFIGISSLFVILANFALTSAILIAFASIPLVIVSLWAGKKNYKAKVDTRKYERRYSYYSDEVLCNREASKERTLFSYTDELTKCYYDEFIKASKAQLGVLFKTRLASKITSISLLIIAMIIAYSMIDEVTLHKITPGTFIGIITALIGVSNTLGGKLQEATKNIGEAKEYMDDLSKLLSIETIDGVTDEPADEIIDFDKIEFNNISFSYPSSPRLVFDGLSFVLEKGKHYAFVGENGAGKSTITKLLTGLYDSYRGDILIDGKDIRQFTQAELKSLFSVLYQDFYHYQISLKDNLILGNRANISNEDIYLTLDKLDLKDMVNNLFLGVETPLGTIYKNGIDLSMGQWQKIAIARSLLNKAPLIILDEPTSALDPITESNLYSQFKNLMYGRTSIFISHRLASTKMADEIFVFDGGKIVEKGTHNELIKKDGMYAKMYKEQSRWYKYE
ncbi:MAG: ABC transporter ATP-binding protein [Anaerococcus sp.]|nr:ABC transporter ATP-binding protein [Anaerococcus sp.]